MSTSTTLLVISQNPEQYSWLAAQDFDHAGITLAYLRQIEGGGVRATTQIADAHLSANHGGQFLDHGAFDRLIKELRPDAYMLLDDGALSRLVRVHSDLVGVPVFALITTREQLENLAKRPKARPDLFFIANADLLPAALEDTRYGATILPTGHPGLDLRPFGPSAVEARNRLLEVIQRWRDGGINLSAPELSIVVPAFREAPNLPLVCQQLLKAIERDGVDAEILLVDDKSPDDTYAVALSQMWESRRIRAFTKDLPRGMGFAIRHGLRHARASIAAITMGDGSDEVARIPEMFRRVRDENYALAIGSRYGHRRNYQAIPRLYRFWSAVFRQTSSILVGLPLRDSTNAFRVFRTSIFDKRGLEGRGFEISPEITFKAWFATGRVVEIDVRHLKRSAGQSNFSFLRAGPGYGLILLKALVCRVTGRWFVLEW